MDPNLYQNQNLAGSMNFQSSDPLNMSGNLGNLQSYTPEQLIQLQQISQQQIQQLQAQLAKVQLAGSTVASNPYANTFAAVSPTSPVGINTGPLYAPNAQSSPVINPNFIPAFPVGNSNPAMSPGGGPIPLNASMNISLNGQMPNISQTNMNTSSYNQMTYPNTSIGINGQLSNQIQVQVPKPSEQLQGQARFVSAPNSLHLQQINQPRSLSSSSYSSSAPSTPQDSPAVSKKEQQSIATANDVPIFMQRPRQQITSPPSARPPPATASDRSSTSSSIPGSPSSSGNPPFSPDGSLSDSFGPISPEGTPKKGINGETKLGSQIKNKPLHMETRYPQDKCYHCMKKVYPMEKLGPVRGVVFHKICFKCSTCNTTLNMKNFSHNQSDSFDKSVYCKSHQPVSTHAGPKLDTNSFEIKSALKAPKTGGVTPESERVPIHKYSYDVTSREIEHARKVPVADLQSGVKARNHAWSKSKRENYNNLPTNIVKHDEQVPEYDEEGYRRHVVETQPDY
ncbi:mediator of RNA polymerase II transcription subunit 15-like [Ruditapes philippinarum]|uniref:mediator of RNA polymerase II transcription subunit 15-like n=1 Tax=Ruditapes philippinarum TaxID=129788 RepID=UPI00295A5E25|nr:mediator of RNA polymerase II transcription subunit 15-like [Ruditapes philippinarum]